MGACRTAFLAARGTGARRPDVLVEIDWESAEAGFRCGGTPPAPGSEVSNPIYGSVRRRGDMIYKGSHVGSRAFVA
jgi:hypothetical protein